MGPAHQHLGRQSAASFSIGGKGYAAGGLNAAGQLTNEVWEYDRANNRWVRKADFPGGTRYQPLGFVLNNKAYICAGNSAPYMSGVFYKDMWEFDPLDYSSDTDPYGNPMGKWTRKADYPGTDNLGDGFAFGIGSKGYV